MGFGTFARSARPGLADQEAVVASRGIPAPFGDSGRARLPFGLLCVLLASYRKSTRVQTHIFYNPLARKILGFGYVDILLVWIGPLRRLLFAPFAGGMAGDIGRRSFGTKEGPYYPDSQVVKLDRSNLSAGLSDAEREALSGGLKTSALPIISGLADWKGPTCLFGPSGRGKPIGVPRTRG